MNPKDSAAMLRERHAQIAAMPLEKTCGGHLSHDEVAGNVRMLMRGDLDHEAVCTMARDRIVWLAGRVAELEAARPAPPANAVRLGAPRWEDGRLVQDGIATPPAASGDDEAFADWLAKEMPPSTVISNPRWWAPRILRAARRLAAVAPAGMDGVFTADEVAEAMEVLRGRHGSTALIGEVLDDMERVLLAALAHPPASPEPPGGEWVPGPNDHRVGHDGEGRQVYLSEARPAAQGDFAAGVKACIGWVEARRHAFEEEYGRVDPSTNAMEFGSTAREEYDAELCEIEEGLRTLLAAAPSPEARPVAGGQTWASDDFYSGHPLPVLHDDPAINSEVLIQALTARLDTARQALAAAAAMQVAQPALQKVKANAAWAMSETDPRRLLPRSVAYNATPVRAPGEVGWQPIETAPKDGSYVLLANYGQEADEGRWHDGSQNHWHEAGWYFVDSDLLTSHPARPDVWMPKPTAPAAPSPGAAHATQDGDA